MRITIAGLRRWTLILACLLVAVLIGFFVYARYRFRHIEKDLPGKLGMNIQRTANGFTYSQSSQGHTLFTIHASNLVQYKKGGQAQLHDVAITLYGPPGSNRADKIYGSDFDYDQSSGIATAQGAVEIELAGPPGESASSGNQDEAQAAKSTIHIKTSGLTFNQKTGEVVTSQHVEFQLPKAAGDSQGASYNSKTGVLILDSQVNLTTSTNGNPATVHAVHAQMLRDSKQAFLMQATAEFQTEKSYADQAIVYFRQDGSAEHIDAKGHVRVTGDDGTEVTAASSQIQMDGKSQPTRADMNGGVNMASESGQQKMHGTAVEGTLTFGAESTLKHAQFRNAVSFVDQTQSLANDPQGYAARELRASKVDVDFVPGTNAKKSVAQKILAVGSAVVTLHTISTKAPEQSTTISGDQLLGTLNDGNTLKQLDGSGHTKIVDQAQDGAVNTSQGDQLHMTFTPPQPSVKKQSANMLSSGSSQVESAIQDGNVVLSQTPKKKPGDTAQPPATTAWARHAEYHAADQILHLTGDPRLNDGQSTQITAQCIDFHRDSGNATALGTVKATYTQRENGKVPAQGPTLGGSGPAHILADRAELKRASDVSLFYGTEKTPARMWQGVNSIWAPVLELSKTDAALKAYGEGTGSAAVVRASLTTTMGAKQQPGVVRIRSQRLDYSDKERQGNFQGSVVAEEPSGVIQANQAIVYLAPAQKATSVSGTKQAQAQTSPQTQIDHIIATGHVVITQPGRKGDGEKLVYTASDGKYVLTGTPSALPRLSDQLHGTTTGAALIFHSQDDSVEVSGGKSSAVTDTRAPK